MTTCFIRLHSFTHTEIHSIENLTHECWFDWRTKETETVQNVDSEDSLVWGLRYRHSRATCTTHVTRKTQYSFENRQFQFAINRSKIKYISTVECRIRNCYYSAMLHQHR